jgi:hypothetical protein
VLLLPPAPAARVLWGLAVVALSARSAAAFRRIAVFGPPGGVGDEGRAVELPTESGPEADYGFSEICHFILNGQLTIILCDGDEGKLQCNRVGSWKERREITGVYITVVAAFDECRID